MARLKQHPRSTGKHPVYSDNPERQKTIEEGVDAQFHSIMDLVELVVHKRLTQFAECIGEALSERGQG